MAFTLTLVTNASSTSGVGKPAYRLADALRERGHAVEHIVFDAAQSAITRDERVLQQISRWPLGGKPLFWLRAGSVVPLPEHGIIHLTNQTLAFLTIRAPERTIVTVWDLIEQRSPQAFGSRLGSRVLFRHLEKAARVIVPSEATARDVRALTTVAPDRIRVIPPACASGFSRDERLSSRDAITALKREHGIPEHRHLVVYVGSEHPRKNLSRVVEALAVVQKHVPLQFVKIGGAGTASGRSELERAIHVQGLTDAVTFIPEAHDDTLRSWYNAASVFVFPSLDEGFGFPPLEALACGTPVVTSNISSLPEVVGDAALTVTPTHTAEIAEAVLRLLTDAQLRKALQEKGQRRAAEFSEERTVAATENVYAEVLRSISGT